MYSLHATPGLKVFSYHTFYDGLIYFVNLGFLYFVYIRDRQNFSSFISLCRNPSCSKVCNDCLLNSLKDSNNWCKIKKKKSGLLIPRQNILKCSIIWKLSDLQVNRCVFCWTFEFKYIFFLNGIIVCKYQNLGPTQIRHNLLMKCKLLLSW